MKKKEWEEGRLSGIKEVYKMTSDLISGSDRMLDMKSKTGLAYLKYKINNKFKIERDK